MEDVLAHLETLRADIAKCESLERSAKSEIKRSIFRRMVAHYKVLGGELKRAIAEMEAKEAGE